MAERLKKLPFLVYWFFKIGVKLLYYAFHIPLSIVYCGKGKTVPPVRNGLLLKSATKLGKEIREGQIKSIDVVRAYIDRILEVEPYINALAENRFHDAVKEAQEIDLLVASGKFSKEKLAEEKPLLGVPFTTKVLLTVKGMHSSAASMIFKDVIAAEDAPTIAMLKKAGGIVLATTNSAELGLGFDTINKLCGKTLNPYDTNRTPGGSSGGESALLGAAGSVIGMGNDITGSVRVPAHFTGVFAHKATQGMVSNTGCFPAPNDKTNKYLCTGPMCRYAEDLVTMMRVLTQDNVEKVKFGQPVDFRKLKIYYQIHLKDPTVQPVDSETIDAMQRAMAHFSEKYGVVGKEVNISLLNMSNEIDFHLLLADIPNVIEQVSYGKIKHLNGFLELLKFVIGKSDLSLWSIVEMGFGKYPLLYKEEKIPLYRSLCQRLYEKFDDLLDENSVFIYPTLPFSAPRPYEMIPLIFSSVYTGIFNFLGLPATQCPLGLKRNGMPHGMQIIGKMNNDPLTLACAEELSKVFGGWIPPS